MPGISPVPHDIVVANDVAFTELEAALAAVHHRVAARIQYPVRPVRASEEAARDEAAVEIAFPLAGAHRRKHVEIHLVEDSGRLADPLDFARSLDPAHLLHHAGAVGDLRGGQRRLEDGPVRGADHRLLESDALAGETEIVQDPRRSFVDRLAVVVEDDNILDPRVSARAIDGKAIEHENRRLGARPDDQHAARRIGEIEMPREGSRVVEPREIREVRPRAQHHRRQPVPVHQRMQALNVRNVRDAGIGVHDKLSSISVSAASATPRPAAHATQPCAAGTRLSGYPLPAFAGTSSSGTAGSGHSASSVIPANSLPS